MALPFLASAQAYNGVSYQGLLLNPAGAPLNGSVNLILRIWNDPASTALPARLYEESHLGTAVIDGVFQVTLGRGTAPSGPFDAALFAQPQRFIEVVVNGEPMAPRQPFLAVAYALQAQVCAQAGTLDPAEVEAIVAEAQSGLAFTNLTGQASDAQIPLSIARDAEVLALVSAADGAGSGLDADLLDGFDSGEFSRLGPSIETTEITDLTIQTADLANAAVNSAKIVNGSVAAVDLADGAGSGVDADLLDGFDSAAFLRSGANFNYDSGSLTFGGLSNVALNGLVSIGSDSPTGDDVIEFGPSEEIRFSITGSEFRLSDDVSAVSYRISSPVFRQARVAGTAFLTASTLGPWNRDSAGYAYNLPTLSGGGAELLAPVDLPAGATITALQCEVYQSSASIGLSGSANLYRRASSVLAGTALASIDLATAGAGTTMQLVADSSIGSPATVSEDAFYWIAVSWAVDTTGGGGRFYGCAVFYSIGSPGPY